MTRKTGRLKYCRMNPSQFVTGYHIGTSLKDTSKKWFAFSEINLDANEMIMRIQTDE